jgi:uncharacterized protein YndB with AHSA1/START domain
VILYKSAVTIARPPEAIFPYLIEPSLQARWSDVEMRRLDDGPFGLGSQLEVTFGMGPVKARIVLRITAVEPGRRMAWETSEGKILWEGEYLLLPAGDSTEVRQEGRLTFKGRWRLIEPLVGEEIKKGEVKELEKLKSVVEAA